MIHSVQKYPNNNKAKRKKQIKILPKRRISLLKIPRQQVGAHEQHSSRWKGWEERAKCLCRGDPNAVFTELSKYKSAGRIPDFSCAVTAGTRQVSSPGGCLLQKILQVLSDASRAEKANARWRLSETFPFPTASITAYHAGLNCPGSQDAQSRLVGFFPLAGGSTRSTMAFREHGQLPPRDTRSWCAPASPLRSGNSYFSPTPFSPDGPQTFTSLLLLSTIKM